LAGPSQFSLKVSILTKKLYVGNLPYDATADELREAFSAFGRVLSATIATDRETGQSRGFGFVELAEGAEEAIQGLNQARFGNRNLTVNEAKPREDGPRSTSSNGRTVGKRGSGRPY
jgi:RNA recognition motif-containing protein